jgi:putative cell wall-binding protein
VAISRATHALAGVVVVARADTYPDALAGGPLAYASQAPILLTDSAALSAATAEEVARLGATTALVLGGETAVGPRVVADLRAMGLDVTRIAGSSRFATAAAVAEHLDAPDRAFVVEGAHADPARGWPDALAVAPLAARLGAPILLVTRDSVPTETLDALHALGPSRVTIVGGTAAVSQEVADRMVAAGFAVDRIAGADRYTTGLAVVDEAIVDRAADPEVTWLATGLNYPDALAAGPAVAASRGQLLLIHGQVPGGSQAVLDRVAADGPDLAVARLVGGLAAISAATEAAVRDVLSDHPYGR